MTPGIRHSPVIAVLIVLSMTSADTRQDPGYTGCQLGKTRGGGSGQ